MNVSIILPTYNRAHIIEECIQGVVFQSYKEWELIILDDASEDNTKEIGEKYQLALIQEFNISEMKLD